jgi:hypothetical protein
VTNPIKTALLAVAPSAARAAEMERLGLMVNGAWCPSAVARLTDTQAGVLFNRVRG